MKSKVTKDFLTESSEAQKTFENSSRSSNSRDQASSELSEAESHTKIFLEEQRNHALPETQFELLLQESRAERAQSLIQLLGDQLRSQCQEMSRGRQEFEFARHEQEQLRAELKCTQSKSRCSCTSRTRYGIIEKHRTVKLRNFLEKNYQKVRML